VDEGREIGRIEGYPGADFFWGLLERLLQAPATKAGGADPSADERREVARKSS
jgi:hypothetical protein